MPNTHKSVFTIMDRGEEKSPHTFFNGAITAVSLPGFLTDLGAYRTALDAIIIGVIHKEKWVGDETVLTNVPPASNLAQRELKILLQYVGDTSQKKFTIEVACPDLAALTLVGKDDVELADAGIMAAYVTAFEQIARSPDDDTETVTVTGARIVGRNI